MAKVTESVGYAVKGDDWTERRWFATKSAASASADALDKAAARNRDLSSVGTVGVVMAQQRTLTGGMARMVAGAAMLGLVTDEHLEQINKVAAAVMLLGALYKMYGLIQSAVHTAQLVQAKLAAKETEEMLKIPDAGVLAIGVAVGATLTAGVGLAEILGAMHLANGGLDKIKASGSWAVRKAIGAGERSFDLADMNTPLGRRTNARRLAA